MAAAGCQLHEDMSRLAVMWFLRVFMNLHRFLALVVRADRFFRHHRPDVVVLIDYPGFNWWIARRAKAHGIPVIYYGTPQLWAWAGWRVRKMRRLVDHILCKLPFEERWYRERRCHATYVGHPYFDELEQRKLDDEFLARSSGDSRPLVTILPGSRTQEVTHNLVWFLRAAERIHREVPHVRFAVASFNEEQASVARRILGPTKLPIEVWANRTPELIQLADCCMACSGSVSLELLYYGKPAVILYWINRWAYIVQGFFRRVRYITLVNLLAMDDIYVTRAAITGPDAHEGNAIPYPEYLTYKDKTLQISEHIIRWLTNEDDKKQRIAQLSELRSQFAHGGASRRAAEYLLTHCRRSSPVPRAHDQPADMAAQEASSASSRTRLPAA